MLADLRKHLATHGPKTGRNGLGRSADADKGAETFRPHHDVGLCTDCPQAAPHRDVATNGQDDALAEAATDLFCPLDGRIASDSALARIGGTGLAASPMTIPTSGKAIRAAGEFRPCQVVPQPPGRQPTA